MPRDDQPQSESFTAYLKREPLTYSITPDAKLTFVGSQCDVSMGAAHVYIPKDKYIAVARIFELVANLHAREQPQRRAR